MKRERKNTLDGSEPEKKLQKTTDDVEINLKRVDRKLYKKHTNLKNLPFFTNAKVEAAKFTDIDTIKLQHGFLKALHVCFSDHQALELNADHFWLLILQGLAYHEEATKGLGAAFGFDNRKKGKKRIEVRRDGFVLGRMDNDWEGVFPEFVEKIKENIPKKLSAILDSKFSTTTQLSQTAFYVSIMDCVQNYFEYYLLTKCGIPKIILKGTKEDYALILKKVQELGKNEKLDLKWWTSALEPILEKILKVFDGEKDVDFWDSIYKYHGNRGSGGVPQISGWIGAFFPYTQGGSRSDVMKHYETGKYNKARMVFKKLPYGISYAPFIWNYLGSEKDLSFYAGFFGCKQLDNLNIAPEFGWAVCHDKISARELNPKKNEKDFGIMWF